MHQILPYKLWIGSSGDVRDWRRLYDLGIRAVVQVAYEEPALTLPHDLVVSRFPLIDGDENPPDVLALAIATLTHFLEQKFVCLVCCQAGLSRSPALAAAALARLTGQPFAVCLEEIGKHHSHAIHPGLRSQVEAASLPK
ncbi:MAG: dual specificity protein phosphatase family protein [Deltaproteobacteria bacterium]|nr:dual specificity protein phosphatase family protein [Deltaproteobacteria bacterium]